MTTETAAVGEVVLALAALVGVVAGLLGIFVTRWEYGSMEKRVSRVEDRVFDEPSDR